MDIAALPIMGNRFDRTHSDAKPGAPLVRINGLILMGNLTVVTR